MVPEIPDLEAVRHFLMPRVEGLEITRAETSLPWLVRTGAEGLQTLLGHRFGEIHRLGKFLLFFVDDGRLLVVNPMLTGRFIWAEPDGGGSSKRAPGTAIAIGFEDGHELRYADERRMGRWYLVAREELGSVPQFDRMGPDALAVDEDEFVRRVMARRGQIKSVLTNHEVVAGIGNAYSDEILWEAGLHPHRRRADIGEEDVRRLYRAMRDTLEWAVAVVDEQMRTEGLGTKAEWRQHLRVHRRGGEVCPRCGSTVRGQERSGSETNYCLTCQPLFG